MDLNSPLVWIVSIVLLLLAAASMLLSLRRRRNRAFEHDEAWFTHSLWSYGDQDLNALVTISLEDYGRRSFHSRSLGIRTFRCLLETSDRLSFRRRKNGTSRRQPCSILVECQLDEGLVFTVDRRAISRRQFEIISRYLSHEASAQQVPLELAVVSTRKPPDQQLVHEVVLVGGIDAFIEQLLTLAKGRAES
jgi:hypothetical protein